MKPSQIPKPLPAGNHRLVRVCIVCWRRVRPEEQSLWPKACPDCGSATWMFLRRPVTLLEKFRAWLELRRWKKRRRLHAE